MSAIKKRDVVFDLAENLVCTEYNDLSTEAVEVAKKAILDILGTVLAGSPEPPFQRLVELLKDEGGKEESTIMVYGGKVPARSAVLANASMARALDLDEVHEEVGLHSCVNLVPAAFAVAERQGAISGKDLITAIVLGHDLMARLCVACKVFPVKRGREPAYVFGTFGTAAVAAKLFGFDVDNTVSALGNAYSRSAGELQCYEDGSLSQRANQGLAASAGVYAAILVQNGVDGCRNVLEGPSGYYFAYENGEYFPEALTDKLGNKFWGASTSFKPYPNCKGIHQAMDATLQIVTEHDIKPDEIEEITVHYSPDQMEGSEKVGFFKPERVDPKTPVDLKFSVPWAVGTMVAKRRAWIEDFNISGMKKIRDTVVPIARKVKPMVDPSLAIPGKQVGPVIIDIKTINGGIHSTRVDFSRGSPQNPFTWVEMTERFRDFASRSVKPIPAENMDRVIKLVGGIEEVSDVGTIVELIA